MTAKAAPSPHAVFASTTAGGVTRSGRSASTTSCAAGRKTYSQTSSVAGRRLTERRNRSYWAAIVISPGELADSRHVDRLCRPDQVASRVDLVPHVPEQESARSLLVVHVRHNALAAGLLPLLHGLGSGIDLSDRLVAEIEEVR